MISITRKFKLGGLVLLSAMAIFSSCNKDLEQFAEPAAIISGNRALGDTMFRRANDSLFFRLAERGGLLPMLNNKSNRYTIFVPDSNAMKVFVNAASGGLIPLGAPGAVFSNFLRNTIPITTAAAVAGYHIIPLEYPSTSFSAAFPNVQLATIVNPLPAASPFLRLSIFPSSRNGLFANNVPIINPDIKAANGYIHEIPALIFPPQRAVIERINTDADLTIFKAAIARADSGTVTPPPTATPTNLQSALTSFGANLTVYAPTNAAMKATISALTGGLIPVGAPDAVFIGFIGSNSITTLMVKGIVSYHIMGVRAFNNNLPTTVTYYNTLLNQGIANHPGIGLQSTFTGMMVSAATVKGVGNATAASILINPTPDPNPSGSSATVYTGSSDQLYTNAVLHKINQVLLPQ